MYTNGAERNIQINYEGSCSPARARGDGAVVDNTNIFGNYTFDT